MKAVLGSLTTTTKQEKPSFPLKDTNKFYLISFPTTQEEEGINASFSVMLDSILDDGLGELKRIIKNSKVILNLKDNWDTLGSERYEQATWEAMNSFLMNYAEQVKKYHSVIIDTPQIYPGPYGSIDISWECEKGGIIINIAKGGKLATFYADYTHNDNQQKLEGEFNPHSFTYKLLPIAKF